MPSNSKVLIIDYKLGNQQSVANALEYLGSEFLVSAHPDDVRSAKAYILPGVGAFNEAMDNLDRSNLIPLLTHEVLEKRKPLLGICLGMQVLALDSVENGFRKGLGWIDAHVVKLEVRKSFPVPHVGWNQLKLKQEGNLFFRWKPDHHFYFDHSYHMTCNENCVTATVEYDQTIVAAVQKENIMGVQFHPEKSQISGLKLFRSFLEYVRRSSNLSTND